MAFVAIYTPRTTSKRPAILMPQSQVKNRAAVKEAVREAERLAAKMKGSDAAWKPIRLSNAIGAQVPVRLDTGARAHEIYLLCGIDTEKVDADTLRSVQSRLASQISSTAEGLITTGIPWAHRKEASHRAQFSGDFVLRNELGAYAMMFPDLPEVPEFKISQERKRNKWVNWAIILLVPLIAVGAYYIYSKSARSLKPADADSGTQLTTLDPLPSASVGPTTPLTVTPTPTPTPAAAPKPIVLPNPYEGDDLTELEKALLELKEMRDRLMRDKELAAKTPESLVRWEREAIRFNRRRKQLISAFGYINTEAGQSALEPIFIEDYSVDLYASPERMQKARGDLEEVRAELIQRREKIDTSNFAAVEEYNDAVEWFNLRAEAFNRAVERSKNWGPPPDATPSTVPGQS